MKIYKIFSFSIIALFIAISFFSCKKDKIDTSSGVKLEFSTDTLTFDTVFVSLGSTTKYITVRNNQNKSVEISKIYLDKGSASSYRLTIDGDAGNSAQNVLIPANDSIYIFVEVTVDPNSASLPFLITDNIVFEVNGNQQNVLLQAYGQNAHFFNGDTIQSQTWTNDLPYVILNSLVVSEGQTLLIQEGVNVYFGGNSGMIVNGKLNIQGGQDSSQWVTFRSYRLDRQADDVLYDQLPGQWLGVFLMRNSGVHEIKNFRMRGSMYGINVGNTTLEELNTVSIDNAPELIISNSMIYNSSIYGLYGFLAKIDATNVLIYDIGRNAFTAALGGQYKMKHCTFYLKSSNYFEHKEPTVFLSDYHYYNSNEMPLLADLNAEMTNTVVDGTGNDELLIDKIGDTNTEVSITNCAYKSSTALPQFVVQLNDLKNQDNGFENTQKSNFHLKESSVLIGRGINIGVLTDIEGKSRMSPPDIGAYEY